MYMLMFLRAYQTALRKDADSSELGEKQKANRPQGNHCTLTSLFFPSKCRWLSPAVHPHPCVSRQKCMSLRETYVCKNTFSRH